MAKLEKLSISGIRNFSPSNDQQIQFTSPLTLILGQNGCGKTTIIEAIKYACCGEIPSDTSGVGHSFLNDPKLCGKTSVKGEVQLEIIDHEGDRLKVVRNRKVIQTDKLTSKTGEKAGEHFKKINGEEIDIFPRNDNIDAYICQVLSVSQSILSNVIFCHQENSLWPLEDGKSVKQKFDQIFDLQQYDKSIDIILKQSKQKKETIKTLESELENAKKLKENVESKRHLLDHKQDKLQGFDKEIDGKLKHQQPIIERLQEISELENQLDDLEQEQTTKEIQRKSLIELESKIATSLIEEFNGCDDELGQKIQQFQNEQAQYSENIAKFELERTQIEERFKEMTTTSANIIKDIVILEQEKKQFDRKCEARSQLFERIQQKFDLDLDRDDFDKDPSIIVENLKENLLKFERKIEELSNAQDIERNKLQKRVDEIREKSIKTNENIKIKRKNIVDNRARITEIDEKLKEIDKNRCKLVEIKREIDDIDADMKKLNKFDENELNRRVKDIKMENSIKQETLQEFECQLKILQQNSINEGKIDFIKQSIEEKLQEIDGIKDRNLEIFRFLFDDKLSEPNLKQIENVLDKNRSIIENLTDQINRKQQEITALETQKSNQIQTIRANLNDLEIRKHKIKEICTGREFTDLLNEVTEKRQQLQKDCGYYKASQIINEGYIEEFKKIEPCCPVCKTKFDRTKQQLIDKILENLQMEMGKIPEKLAGINVELKQQDDLYNGLLQQKNINEEIEVIETSKLPSLRDNLKQINGDLNEKSGNLQGLQNQLKQPRKIVDYCNKIVSEVAKIEQNQQFIEQSRRSIENLHKKLVQSDLNKTKIELESEIDTLKDDLNKNRQIIDNIAENINSHKDNLHRLSNRHNNLIGERLELEELLGQSSNCDAKKLELNQIIERLEREIIKLETDSDSIKQEFDNSKLQLNQTVENYKDSIENKREDYQELKGIYDKIGVIQSEIGSYKASDCDQNLSNLTRQLDDFKGEENRLHLKRKKLIDSITESKEEIVKFDLNLRNLHDNQSLRNIRKRIQLFVNEIDQLDRKLQGANRLLLIDEKSKLLAEKQQLEGEIHTIRGQKDELIVTINEIETELDSPQNRDAHKDYMSKFYELQITKIAIEDLGKFARALEKSLIDFHQKRMKEINNSIREYWRCTYRGNDIEYIKIKSEYSTEKQKDGNKETQTNQTRRTYKYRVVQVKDGIELDMRGRGSAGQQVLACLIIRLAIAEILASRCGILALDEPTTNLDRNNIESLGQTLSKIIDGRQLGRNFQLLIITHDEDFLKIITRSHHVPHFYQITRNRDGFSNITKEYDL